MIVPVVVQVDDAIQLGLHRDVDVLGAFDALAQGRSRVFLHLNVVKLPEKETR